MIATALGNHIGALPYTVIIGRGGDIEFIRAGPLDPDDARRVILAYL